MSRIHPLRLAVLLLGMAMLVAGDQASPRTVVSIHGDDVLIDGKPTYAGRTWKGQRIEGLLMNARLVQGIFDDLNPATVQRWAYTDTGRWDPERNTREFIAAMPSWRSAGLLCFTLNLQGGSPTGYSSDQPWINSAFAPDGSLRQPYLDRLAAILAQADRLGMVVILGYFYFGQDGRLNDETAVVQAVDRATGWILDHGYRHVLIEVNNESNQGYHHDILKPGRIHELIERVKARKDHGIGLLAGTSFGGGIVPTPAVAAVSDFLLVHGNGVGDPQGIVSLVRRTRSLPGAAGKPVIINEDDHFAFDAPVCDCTAAVGEHASWGYFDYRMGGDGPAEGFQSVPVDWRIAGKRKTGFFRLLSDITGTRPAPAPDPQPR